MYILPSFPPHLKRMKAFIKSNAANKIVWSRKEELLTLTCLMLTMPRSSTGAWSHLKPHFSVSFTSSRIQKCMNQWNKGGGRLVAAFRSALEFRLYWHLSPNWAGPIYYPSLLFSHWCGIELVPRPDITWTWILYVLLCSVAPQGILNWKSASKVLQKRCGKISLNLAFGISQHREVGDEKRSSIFH